MNRKHLLYIAVSIVILAFSAQSCKKDLASVIGGDLQPDDEWIDGYRVSSDSIDCLKLRAYTVLDDSSVTSALVSYALGSYYHSDFGTVTANIITQLYENNPDDTVQCIDERGELKDGWKVDSAFMYLSYQSAYPFEENLPLNRMNIRVRKLLKGDYDSIDSETASRYYYNNQDRNREGDIIGDNQGSTIDGYWNFDPNDLLDSIPDPDDSTAMIANPTLQIPISHDYAKELLNASRERIAEGGYENAFMRRIPGIYIEAEPLTSRNGNILYFDFYTNNPMLTVYYSKDTVSMTKVFALDFPGSMTYNYINVDHSTAQNESTAWNIIEKDTLIEEEDKTLGDENVFLQSFFGSYFRVELAENIRDFRDSMKAKHNGREIVINQACLVMHVMSDENGFTPPTSVTAKHYIASDNIVSLLDESNYIGGGYNKTQSEYRIYVTRHLQHLLMDETAENFPISINTSNRLSVPALGKIYGPNTSIDPTKKMKLEVIYTVLP